MGKRIAVMVAVALSLTAWGALWWSDYTEAQIAAGTVNAKQTGTWTVQPGNTANTTAWKVDGSAVTQPISAASLPLPAGASTSAKQPALGTAGTASADVITIQGIASMTAVKVDGSAVTQPVTFGGNGTFFSGQAAVTATAAALAANVAKGVCVKALAGNTIPVYIGASAVTTTTGMELQPGDSQCLPVNNSNLIFVIASTTGASVSFDGTN